jgi:hypothetical protein
MKKRFTEEAFMKNKKIVGFIVIVAIIGFAITACTDGGTTDPCKNGHTPGAAATCETAQTCTICSQIIKAATGHNWGEWEKDTTPATCTTGSKDASPCLNGNCTKTEERTGSHPALGHDLPGAKPATCVATGLTGTGHCNRCGEDETGDIIPIDSDNHDFGEWTLNAIAATCVQVSKDTAACKNTPCTATAGIGNIRVRLRIDNRDSRAHGSTLLVSVLFAHEFWILLRTAFCCLRRAEYPRLLGTLDDWKIYGR